jgi:hypothetical protein
VRKVRVSFDAYEPDSKEVGIEDPYIIFDREAPWRSFYLSNLENVSVEYVKEPFKPIAGHAYRREEDKGCNFLIFYLPTGRFVREIRQFDGSYYYPHFSMEIVDGSDNWIDVTDEL